MLLSVSTVLIIVLVAGALLTWVAGRFSRPTAEGVALVATGLMAVVAIGSAWTALFGAGVPGLSPVAAPVVAVIGLVGLAATVFTGPHLRVLICEDRIEECRLPAFYSVTLLFLAAALAATLTDSILGLFVSLEIAAVLLALLVGFYWEDWAFTVRYRFVVPLLLGLAFSLAGFWLLYSAACRAPGLSGPPASLTAVAEGALAVASTSPGLVVWAVALLVVGLGTKAALAPFHLWIPEAHVEAPAPVGALISGVSVPVGLLALMRVIAPFRGLLAGVPEALMVLGALSMILGVLLVAGEYDLRRLLAHSTVSESGAVVMGLGIGGVVGMAGALVVLVGHAVAKALLCLAAGSVEQTTGSQRLPQPRNLRRLMPITSGCFLAGALAVSGWPPLVGFWGRFSVALAAAQQESWWAVGVVLLTALLSVIVFARVWTRAFASQTEDLVDAPPEDRSAFAGLTNGPERLEPPTVLLTVTVVLALACVALSICPWLMDPAARALAAF